MNISLNWLKEYLSTDLNVEEICSILTSIGLEVGGYEKYESIRGGLKGLVVGEVKTCEPHPDSDHLHLTTVDLGDGRLTPIVCGAPNVAAGQKVVVATVGTVLYDGDKEIAEGTVIFSYPKYFRYQDPELSVELQYPWLIVRAKAYAKSVEIQNEDQDMVLSDNYFDMNGGEKRVQILRGKPEGLKIRSVYDIR